LPLGEQALQMNERYHKVVFLSEKQGFILHEWCSSSTDRRNVLQQKKKYRFVSKKKEGVSLCGVLFPQVGYMTPKASQN
jgi:hypothetical protein